MDVHVRALRYFVAAADELHFTRAAERLFVSQPALSKQISALETALRATLFVRDRRGVTLTGAGTALLPHAREVVRSWDQGREAAAAASAANEASLVVGFHTGIGRGLLPVVRARLSEHTPHAVMRMRQIPWDDSTGGLAEPGPGRSDAAFVWLPLADAQRYEWIDVATEPRVLAMHAAHPLAAHDQLAFGDVVDEPFLALPSASGPARDYWLAADARGGRTVRLGAEMSSAEEAVEALLAGLGVCLLSAGNVELIAREGIAIRPVHGVSPSQLVLAWCRGDDRPLLRALLDAVQNALRVDTAATGPRWPTGADT